MNSSAHDVIDCPMMRDTARTAHVEINRLQRAPCLRQGRQFERRFRDDGERSFGADQQTREIVAHYAFGGVDAGAYLVGGARDGAQA